MMKRQSCILILLMVLAIGCRHEEPVVEPGKEQHGEPQQTEIAGFYLLNEGNMGSNKATLDYYDFSTATYLRNIYPDANPDIPKELGDVGNDLCVYGGKLYAVINCSNKIEVMDAATCKRLGQIDVPNCRYLCFDKGYGYVSSYAGPVDVSADHAQIGYVARFDTATLQLIDQCLVGYQPDEICIVGEKMYVANSGGYMVPNYENTLSVIDLQTFTETARIPVAINLHRVRADRHGMLWVTSRGDYYDVPSRLYCVNPATGSVDTEIDMAVSDMDIMGDSLYFCATAWSYEAMDNVVTYGIVNTRTREVVTTNFIADSTRQEIKLPYGIFVHPVTRDIFVTDARNYVTPGTLYCFAPDGHCLWSARTGDIPAHIAFVRKKIQ